MLLYSLVKKDKSIYIKINTFTKCVKHIIPFGITVYTYSTSIEFDIHIFPIIFHIYIFKTI